MMRAALIVFLALVACSCSQGLGGFCTSHSDCEPPLQCSGRGGQRGVCTYPFDARAVDAAARPPDLRLDATRPDLAVDQRAPAPDHKVTAERDVSGN